MPGDRFEMLRAALGDAFEVIELDSAPGNPQGYGRGAHAVLTGDLREDPPNTAFHARTRTVEFLREAPPATD